MLVVVRLLCVAVSLVVLGCASAPKAEPAASAASAKGADLDDVVPDSYREQPGLKPRRVVSQAADREATPAELEGVKRLMRAAERVRGLAFLHDVPVRVQQKSAVVEYLKSKRDDQAMARFHARWVALGLLAAKESHEDEGLEKLAGDLLGYYEPQGKYLVIAEQMSYPLTYDLSAYQADEGRRVIVHELVHALQDQHFDLQHEQARERTTDELSAFMALVEGDATLSMLDFSVRKVGVVFRSLIEDSAFFERVMLGMPPTLGAAALRPTPVQQPLVFRYRGGALFTARLVVAGGYDAVNAAFRRQPRSTTEILHPEAYAQRFRPARVEAPPLRALRSAGYEVMYDDVLGELEVATYLGLGGVLADDVASEWRGDRFVVLRHGDDYAAVWLIRFADGRAAERAEALANQAGQATQEHKASFATLLHGREVLVLRSLPSALAKVVTQDFERTPIL